MILTFDGLAARALLEISKASENRRPNFVQLCDPELWRDDATRSTRGGSRNVEDPVGPQRREQGTPTQDGSGSFGRILFVRERESQRCGSAETAPPGDTLGALPGKQLGDGAAERFDMIEKGSQ